jgi:CDP-glucose 4,6-dehydratase
MNPDFWRGKRVFLTGHTGFKGSWLACGCRAWVPRSRATHCNHPTTPACSKRPEWAKGMKSVIADIRDLPALQQAMPTPDPRSSSTWRRSRWCACRTRTRWKPTPPTSWARCTCWKRTRQTPGVKAVVNVTTDKCYENREWVWGYRENEPMGGYDPYSNSKGCAELVSAAYRSSFFNAKVPTHSMAWHRHGARRQRHRRRRLGARPADPRHPRRIRSKQPVPASATRMPSAPGSTCWSPCAAT